MNCAEVQESLAALSLDALDVDERDQIEEHLERCPTCLAEHRAFVETVATLALAFPPSNPSIALKRRILRAASASNASTRAPWWARVRLGFPRLQPAPLIASFALALALGTSFWAASLQSQLTEQRALAASLKERAYRYDRVVAVLQSPNVQLREMRGTEVAPSAIGRVYVDAETGNGMLMVRSVPPLAEGRVYQLWWVRSDGTRESGGLLTWTDAQGNSYGFIQCPGPISTWQAVGITDEPAGGSPAPTGRRVLAGSI